MKLEERRQLTDEQCRHWSEEISRRLFLEPWYETAGQILLYRAIGHEVDLSPFIEQAWMDHKKLYFPRVSGSDMEFYRADDLTQFVPGAFHIEEPDETCPFYVPDDNAVMIVPGCAFSYEGDRIGYGKAYYDRYLNRFSGKITLVAAAYEMQLCAPWETDVFDRKMDVIITEQRKVVCNNESGRNV